MSERRSPATPLPDAAALAATVATGVLLIDQVTKLVTAHVGSGLGGMNVPARNSEFSLGLATAPWPAQVALMAAGLAAAGVVLAIGVRRGLVPDWAAGLIVGGALSNLLDRALLGSVRDFLAVGPVIVNLADLAVVLGVIAALTAARPVRTTTEGRR
ncbi:MAG: signal peptidase II [Mycobacteriales bacterium]